MLLLVEGSPVITAATQRRLFYQTSATHPGNAASTACAAGFHMASMWDLYDPTLRYASDHPDALAPVTWDLGEGPPFAVTAWVRSGRPSSTSDQAGVGNCSQWTSSSINDHGSVAGLDVFWGTAWFGLSGTCNSTRRVWCVQD